MQVIKNVARILQEKLQDNFLQDLIKIFILQVFLARFLQDVLYRARKASFLVQDLHDLTSLARKILARFAYFLQDDFYWDTYTIVKTSKYSALQNL